MAKSTEKTRVTRRTVIEETGGEPGESGGGELEIPGGDGGPDPEELDAIAKLVELAGGSSLAKYEVRRVLPSANAGYCGTLAPEELTMERLAEEFGPGTYTVRVRLPGGKFAGSDRVQIADMPKHRQTPAIPAQPVASPQVAQQSSGTAEMIAAMQRATDAQIGMLSGLVKSLIERPLPMPPAPPPPPDTLAILGVAAKLFDKKDSGGSFDQFLKGVEFGKELGGGGGDDMGDLLLKGMNGLKELSQAAPAPVVQRRRLPAPGTVAAQEPAAAPRAAQPNAGGRMNTLQLLQWLGQQTKHLLVQAARQKDPELYAEVFLDNLPAGLDEAVILEHLKAPDAIEKLGKLDARVLQFREWFTEFRDAAVRLIEEGPDDEGEDDEGEDLGPDEIPTEFPPENGGGGES